MNISKERFHYSWIVLVVGTMVVFGSLGLARFGYSVVLPTMQDGLGMDNTQAGMLATANLLGYLALSAIGGALASRYGPRIVITCGLLVAGISMIFTGLVNTVFAAAILRAITGLGSGASNVPVMGLISAWFGAKRRGLASGIAVAGSSVALIILGPLVPFILSVYGNSGWRVSWFIFGGLTVLVAVAGYFLLRNNPKEKGLVPLGVGPEEISAPEKKQKLSWSSVYRSGTVWHLGMVYTAFGFSYIIYMTFFAKFLIAEGGYTQAQAGNLFMMLGWFSLFCGLIWGGVSDIIGRKYALIIVYLIQAVSFCLFALWPVSTGFIVSTVLFGLTAWSIPAIMAATCGDVLGARMAPAALGFITLFFGVGQALGPSVAGALADASGSFYSAFLLAGAVAFFGALNTSFLRLDFKQN